MGRRTRFRQEHTLVIVGLIFVAAGLLTGFLILTVIGLIFLIAYFVYHNRQPRN
jgi:membrane-bound ClpP family serine protease